MNPSTAQAEVVVDELVRNGMRDVVLSPGSRNAPLSLALHRASREERLRLHVRIDERSAGFLALGMAACGNRPVAVVCTSGTATANLHPAVSEAYHAGVPLVVLTADRPPEMRAAGANQTIDQHSLYGTAVLLFDEFGVAENRPGQNAYWRSQICRAWHAATTGPVHLNVPLREPLVSTDDDQWCESLDGRSDGGPWTVIHTGETAPATPGPSARRGLVLVADRPPRDAYEWAQQRGWPVLSETGAVGVATPAAIAAGAWLLSAPGFLDRYRPDQVLCVGRPTVFRQVQALLSHPDTEVLLEYGDRWPAPGHPAPGHNVRAVAPSFAPPEVAAEPGWLTAWQQADQKVTAALDSALGLQEWPHGPLVAGDLLDALPPSALLVLGSSNPARDVGLAARRRPDVVVHRNRGVAGIDGMVSTAIGAALMHDGPSYALLGDLTFLHDSNGLLCGPSEPRPDLTIVVFNDDGGGIFSLLEQGAPQFEESFERVFGTPHGTDLRSLCRAHGVEHVAVTGRTEFRAALSPRLGLRVVEIRADRGSLREVRKKVRDFVVAALDENMPGGPVLPE